MALAKRFPVEYGVRVLRGGGWNNNDDNCRSANRAIRDSPYLFARFSALGICS